ncbi:barstar family protein [Winogradskyella sp.]|jgi:RNAse (barnase) inhibitor barstar|uniref:barstar family protein n=1 Tax=Winogradskyella sp. TaxID=1883156 RepID=UPI0025EBE0B5|nr:barstar family protein [Winogradskyella sp.]MCT4629218.1 barstar family protein [Winogradskyella sp.]
MKVVEINLKDISSWSDFHDVFEKRFNFPDYYGRNLDAWIDCMDDVLSKSEDMLLLDFGECYDLKKRIPGITNRILECCAFLNFRFIDAKRQPKLMVSMFA